jgi:hypothetical protein
MRYGIILTLFAVLLAGCGGMESQRVVQDNVFHSSRNPRIDLEIAPEFQYLGKATASESAYIGGYRVSVRKETHIFGQPGEGNRLEKIILISFHKLPAGEGYWSPNFFDGYKNKLDAGFEKIGGVNYEYCILVTTPPLRDFERELITLEGFETTPCYLGKHNGRILGSDNNEMVFIVYFENVHNRQLKADARPYSCGEWWRAKDMLSWSQNEFLEAFKEACKTDMCVKND